jgi:NAD(P)H-dependent flavin oxidoreductase YrpB (nitropropane dioxygenase family)
LADLSVSDLSVSDLAVAPQNAIVSAGREFPAKAENENQRVEDVMFETRITKLLGIKYPIICGCMQWVSRAELVAAVAEAGGLGIIPAAAFETIDEIKAEVRKTRSLTNKPFAVNVTLIPMGRPFSHADMLRAALDEGVRIIETAGRSPEEFVSLIKDAGATLMHKCARARDAVKAEKLGVDMVTVVGFECGGHPGRQDVSTMVKLARAVELVKIPVAAGGGISDGRGLIAALSLGAEAVVMGTRFFVTRECPVHDNFKQAMVDADETATSIALRTLEPARAFTNALWAQVSDMESKGAGLGELFPLIAGLRGRAAYQSGDVNDAVIPCGQGVGLIHDIPTVAELMERIVSEARTTAGRVAALAA